MLHYSAIFSTFHFLNLNLKHGVRASDTIEKNIYILRQKKRDRESESEGEVSEEKKKR